MKMSLLINSIQQNQSNPNSMYKGDGWTLGKSIFIVRSEEGIQKQLYFLIFLEFSLVGKFKSDIHVQSCHSCNNFSLKQVPGLMERGRGPGPPDPLPGSTTDFLFYNCGCCTHPTTQNIMEPSDPPLTNNDSWIGCQLIATKTNKQTNKYTKLTCQAT